MSTPSEDNTEPTWEQLFEEVSILRERLDATQREWSDRYDGAIATIKRLREEAEDAIDRRFEINAARMVSDCIPFGDIYDLALEWKRERDRLAEI